LLIKLVGPLKGLILIFILRLNVSANKKRKWFDKKRQSLHITNSSSWKLTPGSASKSYTPTNGPEFGTAFETDDDRDLEMVPYESK
jgi:hypothetical protein